MLLQQQLSMGQVLEALWFCWLQVLFQNRLSLFLLVERFVLTITKVEPGPSLGKATQFMEARN